MKPVNYLDDLLITHDVRRTVDGMTSQRWMVSWHGRRLDATASYRDAYLLASALARRLVCNVWCRENDRLLLVLTRSELPGADAARATMRPATL